MVEMSEKSFSQKEQDRIRIVQNATREFVQILAQKREKVDPKMIDDIINSTLKYLQTKGILVNYPGLKK
jgi:hypothetical protein